MSEVLFYFKMLNKFETVSNARKLNRPDVNDRINQIILNLNSKRMVKDGFEPGFQENINEVCSSRGQYNRRLKELGLVECGRDVGHIKDSTTTGGYTNNEEFALYAREIGVDLSDNEIEAIKTGEYFSPDKCDIGSDSTT